MAARRYGNSRHRIAALAAALAVVVALVGCARRVTPAPPPSPPASPDTVEFPSGELRLRGLIYPPAGRVAGVGVARGSAARHPAVLFLHGSGDAYDRQFAAVGTLYSGRGYVLFVPFRRGQGLSGGRGEAIVPRLAREGAERGAAARDRLMAELLATEQLDDVRAALAYLRARPDVDAERVAVAGNSFGGILTVFAAARLPGLRAAVASAPAALTWARAPELRDSLRAAARAARVPIFFLQAANDQDLTPTEALAAEMAAAGRPYRRVIYPTFGATVEEGHAFGYFGGAVYGPDVFAFLAEALAAPR